MPDWAKEAPAGIQTQKRLENNIIINIIGIFFCNFDARQNIRAKFFGIFSYDSIKLKIK
jgi:hypothetical protein